MSLKVHLPSSNYSNSLLTPLSVKIAGLGRDLIQCDFMQRKYGGAEEGRAAVEWRSGSTCLTSATNSRNMN